MKKIKTIPKFMSVAAEARFWDTHDISDYRRELKPIKVSFAKKLSDGITVRFNPQTLNVLRSQARESGVGPTTLIRVWVMEKLRSQREGHSQGVIRHA